jgi:hypothetical protein
MHRLAVLPLAALVSAALSSWAQEAPRLDEVVVRSQPADLIGRADSASEGTVTQQQLERRPLLRPAEVLESVPGLVVTQHSGDGKANQYFLRGFNLDHGSDFATFVIGMPVNLRSHAHGQGYSDLNWLMPELVRTLQYRKGPYAADDGDFATAGSARIDYQRSLSRPWVQAEAGPRGRQRALAAGSIDAAGGTWLGALELAANDGPWDQPERLRKANAVLRQSSGSVVDGHALTLMLYDARWNATEQVPQRAIDSGEIGRYGALAPQDGGATRRASLAGEWAGLAAGGSWSAQAWLIGQRLRLFSTPSGYTSGPEGDQHVQEDRRRIVGGRVARSWERGDGGSLTLAADLRRDDARVGLFRTVLRQRTDDEAFDRLDEVAQTSAAFAAEWRARWGDSLRSTLAWRQEAMRAEVTPLSPASQQAGGGRVSAQQGSPRLSLAFGPFSAGEGYLQWGRGFHSNDARGATTFSQPVPLLVRAQGGELGWRASPLPGWRSTLALWRLSIGSELVFVGDEGVTEPRGASRRRGIEWSNELTLAQGVSLDAELAWSRARFKDAAVGADRVPNAVPLTASLGLAFDRGEGWFAGLRLRYLGAYDLEESGRERSRAFWLAHLRAGRRIGREWELGVDVLNLFDRRANDIEYWGAACSRAEIGSADCGREGRLVHPVEPRQLRVALKRSF